MSESVIVKMRLDSQLSELQQRLDRIKRDLAEPLSPDASEQAVETADDVVQEGEASLIAQEIASTRRAMERLANGSYGQCIRCGATIAAARLAARPEAALCVDCASSGM